MAGDSVNEKTTPGLSSIVTDPHRLRLLAAVSIGREQPMTSEERQMLDAIPHRHTHRGPFSSESLPPGVLARMQHHAMAEHATLALIGRPLEYQRLADILAASSGKQDLDPLARHEMRRWSRGPAAPYSPRGVGEPVRRAERRRG
jgi:hypothetical protein